MTDRVVDLRSDTVTVPTPEMRQAMATAEVGDDFLGEDPTAKRLERRVNELFGAEASVFVPSGRMANIVALQTLTQPGDEVLCTRNAHFLHYEGAALAAVCGAQPHPLPDRRGGVAPQGVGAANPPPPDSRPRPTPVSGRRWARWSSGPRRSSPGLSGSESCTAAGCARWVSSPRPASSPWTA